MFIKNAKLYKNVLVTNLYLQLIMIEISSIYSFWWLIPVFLLSFALAALLYFRNPREDFPKWVSILLASFRFIVFSLLGFLLISPLIKSWQSEVEKAKIIIVKDDSKSMILYGDSAKLYNSTNEVLNGLSKKLSDKFEVVNYSFGKEIHKSAIDNNFNKLRTDISHVFTTILEKYKYRNVGAVILASDGIYNIGNNPIYSSTYSKFPIYTLGFGDTIAHKDFAISRVVVNKTAFIKNKFPMEVSVSAKMMNGRKSNIIITSKGKLIHKKSVVFNSENDFQKHIFYIDEKEAGLKTYKISIQKDTEEYNTINNSSIVNVDVLGSKKKILLLYSSPHPDIAAIRNSINTSEEYELEVFDYRKFKKNIDEYSLVILHQMPDKNIRSASIIDKIHKKSIPSLFIIGSNSGVHYFNALNMGVSIDFKKQAFVETTPMANPDFVDFVIPNEFLNQIAYYPPLYSPYGKYKLSNSIHTILYQQIGSVATKYPQICVSENSGKRNAFIFGEGIWRWRMYDFMENSSFDNFDSFIMKIIRYISIDKKNKRFDVQWENRYFEFDEVVLNAQFYNASYEAVNDANIELEVKNENGDKYNYSFINNGDSYSVSMGRMQAGKYSFVAKVKYNSKEYIQKANFYVEAVELEGSDLLARHDLLRNISYASDAKFFVSEDYDKLADDIINRKDIVDIETQVLQYKDLINSPLLLLLIIILLSVEWFVRKQTGSY